MSSWTNGKYKVKNNIIYLEFIPVFDNLRHNKDEPNYKPDSLVLSENSKIEVISIKDYSLSQILTGGQNSKGYPEKLYYKKGKLYRYDKKGKIIKKKQKGIIANREYDPYFIKKIKHKNYKSSCNQYHKSFFNY